MKEANKKKEEKIKELQDFISAIQCQRFQIQAGNFQKTCIWKRSSLMTLRPSSRKYPYVDFRPNREIGNEVLTVTDLSKTIDGVKVLDNVSFTVGHDDKIAFVGSYEHRCDNIVSDPCRRNGTGRRAITNGESPQVKPISQRTIPKIFDSTDTDRRLADALFPENKDATYVRGFLGRMLFSGDDGLKKVNVLSGGEKVRVMLSKMMMLGANSLILDEPTNHLDMESITSVNNGLIKFPGVVLFTSQDHQFIQTIANRIIELTPNGMIDKVTTYDEYLDSDEMARKRQALS